MDKKIKNANFPKLENLINECIERLAIDWPKIIGQGVNLMFDKFECNSSNEFISRINNLTTVLEYEITGEFAGIFYFMFPSRDAAIISGSFLMEDEEDVKKNASTELITEDYQEAFIEFGNQTAASFDNIFRIQFPENDDTHVKFKKSHFPPFPSDEIEDLFPAVADDDVFIANSQLSVWTFDKGDVSLVFPIDVAESFYNEKVTLLDIKSFAQIIFVSNSRSDISFFKKYIRNTKNYARIFSDGKALIAKLQSERKDPDLILLDLDFEDYDDNGFSLLRKIKRNFLLESIPVITCSSKPTKNLIIESLNLGASDFLVMPFNEDRLFERLEKYTKKQTIDDIDY